MKRTGEQRLHWGRRASVLALVGGLVGWIVAYLGVLVSLQMAFGIHGPVRGASLDQVVAWVGTDPGLGAELILGALVFGGPCGAALGLVIWSVWFLVSRRAGAPDSVSSPHP